MRWWAWCPNSDGTNNYLLPELNPGDNYVDWVGLDGYTWGDTQTGSSWHFLYSIFQANYVTLITMTKKPLFMIGETASAESGGDKALWIKWGLLDALPRYFPRIACVQWFDILKDADWRINSSSPRWMPTGTWLRPSCTRATFPNRKNREGGYFPSRLEPRRRAERPLSAVVQEA